MDKVDLDEFLKEFYTGLVVDSGILKMVKELKASRKIIKCLRKIRTSDCGDLEEIYKALDELDGNNV